MIETTVRKIDVTDVMARVRATVAEIRLREARAADEQATATAAAAAAAEAEIQINIAPPPAPHRSSSVDAQRERLLRLVREAQASTEVRSWIPKPLRRFFRRQSTHNRLVLEAISSLTKTNAQLASRVQQLVEGQQAEYEWLTPLHATTLAIAENLRTRAPRSLVEALASRFDGLTRNYRGELDRASEHLRNLQGQVDQEVASAAAYRSQQMRERDALADQIRRVEQFGTALSQKLDRLAGDAGHIGAHVRNLQVEVDRLSARSAPLDTQIGRVEGQFTALRDEMNGAGAHLRNLEVELGRAIDTIGRAAFERKIGALEQRLTDDASFLKAELAQQRSVLSRLRSPVETPEAGGLNASQPPAPDGGLLDAFYVSFENRFRGPRPEIMKRLEPYLPIIKAAVAGHDHPEVLDVGCGRGEWLELVKTSGLKGRGIDINGAMLAHCRERGLAVEQADVLQHLRGLPDAVLSAVTGFHIIEHLPFEVLMEVLAETLRVLQPGGVAIFESPNCKNVVVGASTFNLDPTHRNPVFPETAEFMLQLQGFIQTQIRYLSPAEGSPFDDSRPEFAYLKDRFFGAQDFSVIGYKAAA